MSLLSLVLLTALSSATFTSNGDNKVLGDIIFTATVVQTNTVSMDIEELEKNVYKVAYQSRFEGKDESGMLLVVDNRINKQEPLLTFSIDGQTNLDVPLGVLAVVLPKSDVAIAKIIKQQQKRDRKKDV